jgi:hypothetical protein
MYNKYPAKGKDGNVILQFEELFAPYTRYCSDQQEQCQQYCREHMQTSELFMAYLAVSAPAPVLIRD